MENNENQAEEKLHGISQAESNDDMIFYKKK